MEHEESKYQRSNSFYKQRRKMEQMKRKKDPSNYTDRYFLGTL